MSSSFTNQLEPLQPISNKQLPNNTITGINTFLTQQGLGPLDLVKPKMIANAHWEYHLVDDPKLLGSPKNRQTLRKVTTLPPGIENNVTFRLNTELLGGQSYPVLTALLGIGAGIASFGGGLLFSAATTALSLSQRTSRVLAREEDEIWKIEEIGKAKDWRGRWVPTHVLAYFLVDPHRRTAQKKGWLIHEERKTISL